MNDGPTSIDAAPVFDENEAAVIDTFVVPAYLSHFWSAASPMLLVGEAARVVHLGSLTGYPAREVLERMPNTTGVGVDASEACVNLAASRQPQELFSYVATDPAESGLSEHTFSHALIVHPTGNAEERKKVFAEAARLLYQGGQALVALPLSQSFPEVIDLIEEFSLKYDDAAIAGALESAASERVTIETISDELEEAGFSDVDFEVTRETLSYDSGRAFLEDPAVRYFVAPQIEAWLDQLDLAEAMEYVGRAIDKYWSDTRMELSLSVAAFSARR